MVYMFLGNGFEESEAVIPLDLMRRAEIDVLTVGIDEKVVIGSHNIPITADVTLSEVDLTALEMVVLPGGLGGVASIRANKRALDLVSFAWENGKYVAAICAAPTILAELHISDGHCATCYPGCETQMGSANIVAQAAVQDGTLITGTSAGCAIPFGLKLIEALKGAEEATRIAQQIVIR